MDEKIIKDAQYRKGASIAFFNATNSAIAMLTADKINMTSSEMEEYITKWRNWFLEEHKTYYALNIANIGKNYDAKESIAKLEACQNIEEMRKVWISFSEDERRDGEIIKIKEEMKTSYEK